jgi:hypothetical protein
MSHGGGGSGGQKSAEKVSRIIWMAPNIIDHFDNILMCSFYVRIMLWYTSNFYFSNKTRPNFASMLN